MLYVWLGIIGVVIAAVVLLRLQQRGVLFAAQNRQELPSERTVFTLEVGDIVEHLDTDWVVEGKLTYDVEGYSWYEYLLQDGDRLCWLSVDEDDRVEVALLEPTNHLEVSKTPPRQISFAGETYHLVDSGVADMTRTGNTLERTAEHCQYFDYEGSEDRVLSVEVWHEEVEVNVGKRISPRSLTLLPGGGQRIYRD